MKVRISKVFHSPAHPSPWLELWSAEAPGAVTLLFSTFSAACIYAKLWRDAHGR